MNTVITLFTIGFVKLSIMGFTIKLQVFITKGLELPHVVGI